MLFGMLKYANNHKDGKVDIIKLAQACNVSESFIQLALEIFELSGAIEILDIDKIRYIEAVNLDKIKQHSLYELLLEEHTKILEFKKHLAEDELDKMYELINNCLV